MIESIELEVLSRLVLDIDDVDSDEAQTLLSYDVNTYFDAYRPYIQYVHDFVDKYRILPNRLDFITTFPDITLVDASSRPLSYLERRLNDNARHKIAIEFFNKVKDLGNGDIDLFYQYMEQVYQRSQEFCNDLNPLDIVNDIDVRVEQVREYSKQQRIPTGFAEIDKAMYGGLSTVEELVVLVARLNNGKTWICMKIAETAQKNGFPVAYYSPEMQGAYLGTRFDTWRGHFENNKLFKGEYSDEYLDYVKTEKIAHSAPFYVLEDKHFKNGASVSEFSNFVRRHQIKLLIVDGISYMQDDQKSTRDQEKYRNIALGLFKLSKKYGCAVVLVMQANREVRSKDSDKGESIPDLFNTEGSDQPGRIATQAFGIRQIFEEHKLDIKMLKSRNASNRQDVYSYAWSINTGDLDYVPNSDDVPDPSAPPTVGSFRTISCGTAQPDSSDLSLITSQEHEQELDEYEEDIEF